MNPKYELHTQGPWFGDQETLVYSSGSFHYLSNPSYAAEGNYVNAKYIVAALIAGAVDAELPSISTTYRNNLIDAICQSWVTKVNMGFMKDNTIACNLMIPVTNGGLEIRQNGEIHFWTRESVDMGTVNSYLTTIIRSLVRKVYNFTSSKIANTDRANMFSRMILVDVFNQLVITF